jgi:ABC-type nitrate/sulfonate/bicarbonate transport system substrate-binding protein
LPLIIFGIALYWTDIQHKKDAEDDDGLTFMEVVKGSANSMWLAFTTGSTIGYGEVYPQRTGARLVAVVCFFSVAILVSSLTATITSFNVVQQINVGIQDASDLKGKTVATVAKTTSVDAAIRYGREC